MPCFIILTTVKPRDTKVLQIDLHLARVTLWPGNFPEAFIKRQVMPNGVLLGTNNINHRIHSIPPSNQKVMY